MTSEIVRLELELAKWKALAETLAGALEQVADYGDIAAVRIARQALGGDNG